MLHVGIHGLQRQGEDPQQIQRGLWVVNKIMAPSGSQRYSGTEYSGVPRWDPHFGTYLHVTQDGSAEETGLQKTIRMSQPRHRRQPLNFISLSRPG